MKAINKMLIAFAGIFGFIAAAYGMSNNPAHKRTAIVFTGLAVSPLFIHICLVFIRKRLKNQRALRVTPKPSQLVAQESLEHDFVLTTEDGETLVTELTEEPLTTEDAPDHRHYIIGTIQDQETEAVLKDAIIKIKSVDTDAEYHITTGNDGFFKYKVPYGKYNVTMSLDGYLPVTEPCEVSKEYGHTIRFSRLQKIPAESKTSKLDELQEQILAVIWEDRDYQNPFCGDNTVEYRMIALQFNLGKPPLDRAMLDHHIRQLCQQKYIKPINGVYETLGYTLTDKGSDYVIQNNLRDTDYFHLLKGPLPN